MQRVGQHEPWDSLAATVTQRWRELGRALRVDFEVVLQLPRLAIQDKRFAGIQL